LCRHHANVSSNIAMNAPMILLITLLSGCHALNQWAPLSLRGVATLNPTTTNDLLHRQTTNHRRPPRRGSPLMVFESFSGEAVAAVMFAQQESKRLSTYTSELEPVHLLLGVLYSPEGSYRALQRYKAYLPEVSTAVEKAAIAKAAEEKAKRLESALESNNDKNKPLGGGDLFGGLFGSKGGGRDGSNNGGGGTGSGLASDVPFSKEVQRVLPRALELSGRFGSPVVNSEHVLLALLLEGGVSLGDSDGDSGDEDDEGKEGPGMDARGGGRLTRLSGDAAAAAAAAASSADAANEEIEGGVVAVLKSVGVDAKALLYEVVSDVEAKRGKAELVAGGAGKGGNKNKNDKDRLPALSECCVDLTALARQGKLDPVAGRQAEVARALQVLVRRRKSNPCLIGDPGVGKTAIAEGIAQRIVRRKIEKI
jgi:ATP-dependent Clp protease ATP-binding subunit ClpA